MSSSNQYIGRFAPSPTGPLHFGSLVAALASFLEAKVNKGKWLLRMEDLDKPREVKGTAADILCTLEAFGFAWDGEVIYQSNRTDAYQEALNVLQQKNLVYQCTCSRKEIADSALTSGLEGKVYPKTCLTHTPRPNIHAALRAVTPNQMFRFKDKIQGHINQNLATEIGDFVLKRADRLFAYQLAVVVDDFYQGVTHIVRGSDLLDSTPRQIYLQQLLNFSTPAYAHVPIALNANGEKLSKQTFAEPISTGIAAQQLYAALCFLGQKPPLEMQNATLGEVWRWAFENWSLVKVQRIRAVRT